MANLDLTGTGVALKKLVNHLINGKVEYLVVLGTTGESVTLSKQEKQEVMDCVVKENKNRVPLVLGVGGNNTSEVVDQIKKVDAKAFSAILSVSPYYNKPSQEGIYQHYKAVANASKLPIILYNVPTRTSSNMTAETTVRLAKDFKNIIAVKEASGNLAQCMQIINKRPKNFLVISGDDNLTLPIIACGGDGVISVVANAYPKDYSDMVRSALHDDLTTARKLHYKLMDFTDLLFADGNPGGVKYALSLLKITDTYVRLPLVEPNSSVKQKIKDSVKNL
jgi:4-hydroxy-tetrahydrodipicolinate synthase